MIFGALWSTTTDLFNRVHACVRACVRARARVCGCKCAYVVGCVCAAVGECACVYGSVRALL